LSSACHRCALLACVAALGLMTAGCTGQGPSPAASASPLSEHVPGDRFSVTFSGAALQVAHGAGINLPAVVSHALEDYRDRHPRVSWAALTSTTSAATILAVSGDQPCAT
jgi:hypothetical protein